VISLPSLFISHGSPQMMLDKSAAHDFLVNLPQVIGRPAAIVVMSAHWETRGLKVTAGPHPQTIHDFGGFDSVLYQMTYPAPGAPDLAVRIQGLFAEAGMVCDLDAARGLDHGAWIPLKIAFPEASIPVLQVSVPRGASPEDMMEIGRVLAVLRHENILIMGSGSLTHNLYEFRGQGLTRPPEEWVSQFADWMHEKLENRDIDQLIRYRAVAPFAKENHPTEEHLLPLYAAMGAAGLDGRYVALHRSYNHAILAMDMYGFGLV
jgi:4,5-DOPA dioxygenase extradiol